MGKQFFLMLLSGVIALSCKEEPTAAPKQAPQTDFLAHSKNILDYRGQASDTTRINSLVFSDQGAWFGYSLPNAADAYGGFTGPFLMTQENGKWIAPSLSQLQLLDEQGQAVINFDATLKYQNSYASHLEQGYANNALKVTQKLVFATAHTALQQTEITNLTQEQLVLHPSYLAQLYSIGITAHAEGNLIALKSTKSKAMGYVQLLGTPANADADGSKLNIKVMPTPIEAGQSVKLVLAQTFIFPEYGWEQEQEVLQKTDFDALLTQRKAEKTKQIADLVQKRKSIFKADKYAKLLAKTQLTLQNNWRVAAGELKHQGLFPSYHYEWFHGFWSWDSWKHAVGLSHFNTQLAQDQMRAMYDFQLENGFIVDCVYRDTSIEPHNYRDTKPPLSAWAVAKIFEKDGDTQFLAEMYPKLKKYHAWWYADRDHDQDGLCEYGSTDGTVIAAKWESGMDNAIRFDATKMLKNGDGAYSMDQESVDLNAFLYAEKIFLAQIAKGLGNVAEEKTWKEEAETLKARVQAQFYDEDSGWFFDTNLAGDQFVKGAGSEGWIPLWAQVASQEQAQTIKDKMMDPKKFYVTVPFQTMAADHPKFNPLKGYWRGPNWLDQSYFGVQGLRNYGFKAEADSAAVKIIQGAQGLLEPGKPIYENYHPLTGEGLYAQNFSWSAAHLIMLMTQE